MEVDPRDQRIQQLEAENQALRAQVAALSERISELERENARQAAPFRRKDKNR